MNAKGVSGFILTLTGGVIKEVLRTLALYVFIAFAQIAAAALCYFRFSYQGISGILVPALLLPLCNNAEHIFPLPV